MTAATSSVSTAIVRWTLNAFRANPDASDDDVIAILVAAGVPHASRAAMMVPLAFGRRILTGLVELSDTCVIDDRELVLADDDLYAAAEQLARDAGREDIELIGMRSSEVNGVNQALHGGANPEDLTLSPPTMTLTERDTPPLPDAQAMLDELVRAHGSALALEARVFPGRISTGRVQLQLDVVARVGDRELVESFGGFGTTITESLADTFDKLVRGTLHVLLAVLDRRELGGDQVDWESWGDFDACLGSLLRMWSPNGPPHLAAYLDALKARLLGTELAAEPHWARTYLATNGSEQLGLDMLLDNHGWPPGEELARTWAWPVTDDYYALRHFFMLVPSKRETN